MIRQKKIISVQTDPRIEFTCLTPFKLNPGIGLANMSMSFNMFNTLTLLEPLMLFGPVYLFIWKLCIVSCLFYLIIF